MGNMLACNASAAKSLLSTWRDTIPPSASPCRSTVRVLPSRRPGNDWDAAANAARMWSKCARLARHDGLGRTTSGDATPSARARIAMSRRAVWITSAATVSITIRAAESNGRMTSGWMRGVRLPMCCGSAVPASAAAVAPPQSG